MFKNSQLNDSGKKIFFNALMAAVALFFNGFGVYLLIHASIGAGPWDVLSLGIAHTAGILYGNAAVAASFTILFIDVLMRESIGIAMFIDAVVVGKTVDFFNWLDIIPQPQSVWTGLLMMTTGLFILGYTQYFYMSAALGCGPRDTLIVGLARRFKMIPIGVVMIIVEAIATLIGWLLGGPVGIGTIYVAALQGPIMQLAFFTIKFDATGIKHQNLIESFKVITGHKKKALNQ